MFSIPRYIAYILFALILGLSFIPFEGYKKVLIVFLAIEFLKSRILKKISLLFKGSSLCRLINLTGIEVVTVGTLVAGVLYGSSVAAAFGGVAMITHYLGRMYLNLYALINIPMYILLGFVSGLLTIENFVFMGIVMNISYLIINGTLLGIIFKPKIYYILFFWATNILTNLILIPLTYSLILV